MSRSERLLQQVINTHAPRPWLGQVLL